MDENLGASPPDGRDVLKPSHIVGIGASAGWLQSLQAFFSAMPSDSGMSFVVIQHLSPMFKSMLGDILSKDSSMRIRTIEEGMLLEPNCVYLNVADKDVSLFNGTFRLLEHQKIDGGRLPIDFFLRSLAKRWGLKRSASFSPGPVLTGPLV